MLSRSKETLTCNEKKEHETTVRQDNRCRQVIMILIWNNIKTPPFPPPVSQLKQPLFYQILSSRAKLFRVPSLQPLLTFPNEKNKHVSFLLYLARLMFTPK